MKRGWTRAIAAGSSLGILLALVPDPALADGNAGVHLHKVVDPLQLAINPNIGLSLGLDKSNAIPGDTLTYTATVTNSTATFGMGGHIDAQAVASADATVAYYWDELEICNLGCGTGYPDVHWMGIAAFVNGQSGYQPVTPPAVQAGMTFAATPVNRTGVTYPTSGDPILGTDITPTSTATWTYVAKVVLTPAQIAILADPTQVTGIRNVIHFEVTVRNTAAAQPYTDPESFANPFQTTTDPGAVHAITVTFTLPDGTAAAVGPAQAPSLALLTPGGSVTAGTTFKVPVPAPRASAESESDYAKRLAALDGAALNASAVASGTGFSGTVSATSNQVTTTENVPIVTIAKSGPQTIDAGATEDNPLALTNIGGASASAIAVTDTVPSGGSGTVTGLPATLASGGSASGDANFPVPATQPEGNLTDTAAVTWKDANGNPYGSFTSSFTTVVRNLLSGGRLTLAPATAGPNPVGTTQQLTATLVDRNGDPAGGRTITLTITGANPGTFTATTGPGGDAAFSYTGAKAGNDVAQATFSGGGVTLTSNTSTISWGTPLQPMTTSVVSGNFFPNPNNSCTIDIAPASTPAFAQDFPDILFNAPAGSVPHDISGVNEFTHPFTDKTVDVNGNYNGEIVAQGAGQQAGSGSLTNFEAEFTGTFIVNAPGDLTLTVLHDDAYILGVGGGATRVNGDNDGNPPANTSFNNYPVVAAFDQGVEGGSHSGTDTIHFPAAGAYPYELDYSQCGGASFLVLESAKFVAQTDPLSVYVGYADGLRPGGSIFPFPWNGSPNVIFVGGGGTDDGAIRFDNSGTDPITFDSVTVDIGPFHYDIWGSRLPVTLPPGQILILTATNGDNFDTSDTPITCTPTGYVPQVHVTIGGVVTTFKDTTQVLNTGGIDIGVCTGNESKSWTRIGGGGNTINVPLPPGASLVISPFKVNATIGQSQVLTVSAMDGAGNPVANLPITLQVFGVNPQTLTGTTANNGLAAFNYVGLNNGVDSIQASALVGGLREISNAGTVSWIGPGGNNGPPPPTITSPSPADGSVVTKPVSVSATIAPPSGATITGWRVFYQALDPGPQVLIGSGTGTPPATLATFDPTLVPNDTYAITVEATASNGGVQDVTTTVTVIGNFKPGRYVTTFQDLSVAVNGFQMEVRRSYDSIDKVSRDFGVGSTVSAVNFRVAPNRTLGGAGWTQYNKQCALGLCFTAFKNSSPRFVTVTFPDQHTEVFDFTPEGGTNLFWACTPQFTARPGSGTTSTLSPLDDTSCSYTGDGNLYGASGLYSPKRFQLTTHDGRVLVLDAAVGLVSETDRNGNSLTVDSAGIHSSTGESINFVRDTQGRITKITGPSAQTLTYTYSASGDLASVIDANGNTTSFTYDSNHDMLKVDGPGGPLQTLEYDASGRLISYTDATGNTTQVTNDVTDQKQVVIDATGTLTTVYTMDDLGDVIRTDQTFGGQTLTSTATFDPVGRPLTRTDPLGHTMTATYDSTGNFLSFIDAGGAHDSAKYDSFGGVTAITDQAGGTTTFTHDSNGNISDFTDALGHKTQFAYNASGNTTQRTDPSGQTWTYTYDAAGNQTSQTDPTGAVTGFTYDASGRLLTETNALGVTNKFAYDGNGNLTSVTDGRGGVTRYTYDALNRKTSETDALGNETKYAYDAAGRLTAMTDPLGNKTTYTYDADGRLLVTTDPMGRTTTNAYDGFGRLISTTDAAGGKSTSAYDAAGHRTSSTDPLGRTTTFAYDAVGRLISITDPLGNVTKQVYDAKGRLTETVNALGQTTRYAYDAADNALTVTDPTGAVTSNTYDADGRLLTRTDPLGHVTRYAYDALGRQVSSTDPLGRTTSSVYDALGEVTSTRLPSGATTTYTYDPNGNRLSVSDPMGDVTHYEYDAAGRTTRVIDANGNATTYAYDADGRQVSITDALGGVARTTYDADGEVFSVTNPRGDKTLFAYNALGGLVSETSPSGGVTAYAYDAAGQRIGVTDPRGVQVTYAYDGAGNQVTIGTPAGPISSAFDAIGQKTSMTDPTGKTSYAYDAAGRLTSVAAPQGTVSYAYDAAGDRTSMTLPGGRSVSYGYDAAGQLASLTDWFGQKTSIGHDVDGHRTSIGRPNGVNTTYAYDAAGRVVAVNTDGASGPIAHFAYTLDPVGNRTSVASGAATESYTFDALNRITHVTYPNADSVAYTYDAAGNRTSMTVNGTTTSYTYDSGGRLTAAGSTAMTYDAAGNLTSSGSSSYSYDWADRLVSSNVGGVATSYAYDGSDVRVSQTSGGSTTSYLWDRAGSVPMLVDDGSHGIIQSGGLVEQLASGGSSASLFAVPDGLGSIRATSDSTGGVVGTTNYDVFGGARSKTGSSMSLGYAGEQTDAATGFVYLRARYMDPTVGRFISADSTQPNGPGSQGLNEYSYAANNPITGVDPTGHDEIEVAEIDLTVYETEYTAEEQAAADAAEAASDDYYFTQECLILGIQCNFFLGGLLILAGALLAAADLCMHVQCAPAGGSGTSTDTSTQAAPQPPPAPETAPQPEPEPISVLTKEKPRVGMPVYRVWQYPGGLWYSAYWTPADPRAFGSQDYRYAAGLPDVRTLGNCLVSGILVNTSGVTVTLAAKVAPPASYHTYNGGLVEYNIPSPWIQVGSRHDLTLIPPYGGNPDNPPKVVPACPAQV